MEAVFERIGKDWGEIDFAVHSIAFSPKDTLQGRVVDAPRDGFLTTMEISCWSFLRMAHLAEPLMKRGGTLFTMTYYGSQMVVENYNIMGVAKAALESAVRYLAAELGPKGIRVACHIAGAARDAGRVGNSRVRRASRQGKVEGASSQTCQHRRRRRRYGLPRARCRAAHHRRDALRRRRIPHHRLSLGRMQFPPCQLGGVPRSARPRERPRPCRSS